MVSVDPLALWRNQAMGRPSRCPPFFVRTVYTVAVPNTCILPRAIETLSKKVADSGERCFRAGHLLNKGIQPRRTSSAHASANRDYWAARNALEAQDQLGECLARSGWTMRSPYNRCRKSREAADRHRHVSACEPARRETISACFGKGLPPERGLLLSRDMIPGHTHLGKHFNCHHRVPYRTSRNHRFGGASASQRSVLQTYPAPAPLRRMFENECLRTRER